MRTEVLWVKNKFIYNYSYAIVITVYGESYLLISNIQDFYEKFSVIKRNHYSKKAWRLEIQCMF